MAKTSLHIQYLTHKRDALRKGVAYDISFEDWKDMWNSSGHFQDKGSKTGQYTMVRLDKTKPFTFGNIEIKQRKPYDRNDSFRQPEDRSYSRKTLTKER